MVCVMLDEICDIKWFLKVFEVSLQCQVILEVWILEVVLDDGYQQGINWFEVVVNVGSIDIIFVNIVVIIGNEIFVLFGVVISLLFLNQDFFGVIFLLFIQGNVQVFFSFWVMVINNQKVVIKVGDDEYFVMDVFSQNIIMFIIMLVVFDIEFIFFFLGIVLDVIL